MSAERDVFRFGPFELDTAGHRLMRGRQLVALPARQLDVLVLLLSNAGAVVTKNAVTDTAWPDVAVSDHSITQLMSGLRKALGRQKGGAPYIATVVGRGYRFTAPVTDGPARRSRASLDEVLAPYCALMDGRAAVESFNLEELPRAHEAFDEALRTAPSHAGAHVGLATAYTLEYDAMRVSAAPNRAALERAECHARTACRLKPSSADAWGTLAVVLHRTGDARMALAAANNAVTLEPKEWRHYFRLASVSWGSELLRATQQLLALCPRLAFVYWFEARVFIARGAFDPALAILREGCAAQDEQHQQGGRLRAVGLHWLHALVLASLGSMDAAFEELARERILLGDGGHVYARECAANVSYATGALSFRSGRQEAAEAGFREALTIVPGHPMATVGLAALLPSSEEHATSSEPATVEAAIVHAAALAVRGRQDEAARVVSQVLAQAPPGAAGWLLPAEPLIAATAHRHAWTQVLAILRLRAE